MAKSIIEPDIEQAALEMLSGLSYDAILQVPIAMFFSKEPYNEEKK